MACGIQLVNNARVRRAALVSSSVEVASRVTDHSGIWVAPIGPAREVVERDLMAGRIQLVNDAIARRAAALSSSVEVAGRVADHSCKRVAPIGPTREGVQHRLLSG